MASSNCLHSIKILNIHDNIEIPHQILLIKGLVENPKCFKTQDIELCVEEANILSTGLSQNSGRFKFLVDLGKENKNIQLTFTYCNAKLLMNISYRRRICEYKIQPLLLLAQDEPDDCAKVRLSQQIIDLNLLLIQMVYAEKLKEIVKERLTFVFHNNCVIFRSNLKQSEICGCNEQDLWLKFAKELLESEWGKQDNLKFIAFINCTKYHGEEVKKSEDYSYHNIRKHIKGHAALGAGGLALFSVTYFYSWPSRFEDILKCFLNQQKLNLAVEPDDSNYRRTRAGVYASSLGAVCHEIGHIFDLGHDLQGVMDSNFDYINRVFTLQTKTENLPKRIVEHRQLYDREASVKSRFTCLKDPANGFLQRYREQQENDSFYFSHNSAVILSHHPWLRNDCKDFQKYQFELEVDTTLKVIRCLKVPLKLVELRECKNSLVLEWFEFQKSSHDKAVYEFDLKMVQNKPQKEFYIFLMSVHGHTRKIEL